MMFFITKWLFVMKISQKDGKTLAEDRPKGRQQEGHSQQ